MRNILLILSLILGFSASAVAAEAVQGVMEEGGGGVMALGMPNKQCAACNRNEDTLSQAHDRVNRHGGPIVAAEPGAKKPSRDNVEGN
jgi:hypothetical protein